MSYQSFGFIVFSAIVMLIYYLVGRKHQLWILALANLIFYMMAGIKYLPFILVTMVATFLVGKKMGAIYQATDDKIAQCTDFAEKKQLRGEGKKRAKRVLLVGGGVPLALLIACKYTGFILKNVNAIFAKMYIPEITIFNMILPLGISFYSFMALSYVLDIYWKRYRAETNFLIYAVYLSYFPHVVQGPIDRFNEFKNQVKDGVSLSWKNITFGAQLALLGFFKKLVIADRLGIFVDTVFEDWASCEGSVLFIAVLVYSIQIYTDFSGCVDIVTGVSEMFGIRLRKNFNHPCFSKTMAEFWRRWHISLQEWFKDYVYYPVSASGLTKKAKKHFQKKGNQKAAELFAICFPVLVVWMMTGIWHGAAWNFVAWGMFHASVLIGSTIFDPLLKKLTEFLKIDTGNFGWHFIQMTRTYMICCAGRIFFRAAGLKNAFLIIKKIFTTFSLGVLFDSNRSFGLEAADIFIVIAAIEVLWIVDMLQEKMCVREALAKQNVVFRWVVIFAGLFAVIIFGVYGPGYDAGSFIYEQF